MQLTERRPPLTSVFDGQVAEASMKAERRAHAVRDGALTIAILGCVGWMLWPNLGRLIGHRRFGRHYRALRLGMTRDEVTRAMNRQPDCVAAVGRATVAYYATVPEDVRSLPACASGNSGVKTWEDLPVVYAAAEVAFDASGHSVAQGFCGEGGAEAIRGKGASCMRHLEADSRPQQGKEVGK